MSSAGAAKAADQARKGERPMGERYVRRNEDGHLYAVSHRVYVDEAVYERELQSCFKDQWCFVGLEAEVPEPGTYKTSWVADVPVVVVRDETGKLHVYENVCLHRGAKLVRKRCGKATSFTCMYHSWSFDLTGKLLGVPMPAGFPPEFKKEEWKLSELARVETFCGLIFASYRADIEPLADYLGDFQPFLHEMLQQGELEFLGYQRYHVKANWKLFVENTIDAYHPGLLHLPIMQERKGYQYKAGAGYNYKFRNGHGLLEWPVSATPPEEWNEETDLPLTLCLTRKEGWSHVGNIFPNAMVLHIEDILTIRQLIPRGIDEVDVITYNLARKGESDEIKRHRAWVISSQFGIAGVASLDDKVAMEAVQIGAKAKYTDTILLRGDMAAGKGDLTAEISLRGFYEKWAEAVSE